MATYKSNAGNILQPGAQINRLSSYNTEGVYAWPGVEAYELIGYAKVSNLTADKASFKSFDLVIPSPDRRPDDRVRDNRTSMVVNASAARPAYVYGASIAIAQDVPSTLAGFPATPVTCDLGGTTGELLLFGPSNSGVPFGVPAAPASHTGLTAASASLTAASSLFTQGSADVANGKIPFLSTITTAAFTSGNFANSVFYRVTSDTTFKVFNVAAITDTTITGGGVFISATDSTASKSAYIVCRVNYLRPAAAASWNDIQGFIDFASQQGGDDT